MSSGASIDSKASPRPPSGQTSSDNFVVGAFVMIRRLSVHINTSPGLGIESASLYGQIEVHSIKTSRLTQVLNRNQLVIATVT